MMTLALQTSSLLPSPRNMIWDDRRLHELPLRPQSPPERIELPSIRQVHLSMFYFKEICINIGQAIPEIQLRNGRGIELEYRGDGTSYSQSAGPEALIIPPEYAYSPSVHMRRMLSEDNDSTSGDRLVPRIYRRPKRPFQSQSEATSPASARRASAFTSIESWSSSDRINPYIPAQRHGGLRSPPPFESTSINRFEWRPTLPSLPSLTFEGGVAQASINQSNWTEYALEVTRPGAQTFPQVSTSFDPPPSSHHADSISYKYQQPRGQSYSGPSTHSSDKTPFPLRSHHTGHPGSSYPYGTEMNDGTDGKQRKRRGNLRKETTDKLRAWFVNHLQHPYPTEDEKQELMKQTGLQMSRLPKIIIGSPRMLSVLLDQISNWFINARRRQLPAMINNAKAESNARSARGGERGEVTDDFGDERDNRSSITLGESDDDGSGYDDECDWMKRHPVQGLPKRDESSASSSWGLSGT